MQATKPTYQITKHPIGSVKEIWTISWPLILGLICNGMMVVVDRVMLGHYSLDAMNAASASGAAAFSIFVLPMVVAGISEVFVGRFHGMGQNHKMGSAVWQMIWFALAMTPVFMILGFVFGPMLFNNLHQKSYALSYFYIIINFGTLFCLNQALMGFFIGQGKVGIITVTVAFANLANIALDYIFIFGTSLTPSFGIAGAAYATVLSQVILIGALFFFFIRKKNRLHKGTANWRWNKEIFIKSLKTGVPASFAHLSEYLCFFFFLKIMGTLGADFLTIAVLLNSVYTILYFIIEGISKGVTAIASNLIGAGQHQHVKRNLSSAFILHVAFVGLVSLVFYLGSSQIFSAFVGAEDRFLLSSATFMQDMRIASLLMCLTYLFDGLIWIQVGMLTAAGDTRFIMMCGSVGPWVILLAPVYLFTKYFNLSVPQVWWLVVIYSVIETLIYWLRYKSNAWRRPHLLDDPSLENIPETSI